MEHFITEIEIDVLRHLRNITIKLDADKRQHLILTGKNGSGKTSVLNEIKETLHNVVRDGRGMAQEKKSKNMVMGYTYIPMAGTGEHSKSSRITYSRGGEISDLYAHENFITAFFPAVRPVKDIRMPKGVEEITLKPVFSVNDDPARDIWKYMVHLKSQFYSANVEHDAQTVQNIDSWFNRFDDALKILFDDDSVSLRYDYKQYVFFVQQRDHEEVDFNKLSDGYASVFRIFADLIMRMDQNWLSGNQLSEYNKEGVVLIDEIETHLHLELQRTILPSLIKLFPRVQFIISTHSPFVLSSIENVVIYDLENNTLVNQPQGLTDVPYDGIVEGYFRADKLSALLRGKYDRFKELMAKKDVTDEDMKEISQLEVFLDEIPDYLALDISTEYKRMKSEFEAREDL